VDDFLKFGDLRANLFQEFLDSEEIYLGIEGQEDST
jgi:hypothetical protein